MINSNHKVLLVDDDEQVLINYELILRSAGMVNIVTEKDSRKVMTVMAENNFAAVVLDLTMPHISGDELLPEIRQEHPQVPVIVATANDDIEIAIECMKNGAGDYLLKPVERSRFISSIHKAVELRDLQDEVSYLSRQLLSEDLEHRDSFSGIITQNKKMFSIFRYVEAVVKTERPICICGETGTGKELIAHSIYNASGLEGGYITVNVAGLDDTMFSDTLFGHKRGAYTGADRDRQGLIAQASGGMILLDEIGDLSEQSQLKLLRLLEKQQYYPLGSDIPEKSNVRIIVATNKELKQEIIENNFRKDLYYRLCTHTITVPPLRERAEDISILLNHFIQQASESLSKKTPSQPDELVTLLNTYDFPGNVRELQAMVYDALAQHTSGILSMKSFKQFIAHNKESVETVSALPCNSSEITGRFPTIKEIENEMISEAMKRADGNQGIAATMLGMSRQTLNKRLKKSEKNV